MAVVLVMGIGKTAALPLNPPVAFMIALDDTQLNNTTGYEVVEGNKKFTPRVTLRLTNDKELAQPFQAGQKFTAATVKSSTQG